MRGSWQQETRPRDVHRQPRVRCVSFERTKQRATTQQAHTPSTTTSHAHGRWPKRDDKRTLRCSLWAGDLQMTLLPFSVAVHCISPAYPLLSAFLCVPAPEKGIGYDTPYRKILPTHTKRVCPGMFWSVLYPSLVYPNTVPSPPF